MKTLKPLIKNQSGFSLTELLVVIVIIGILAAMALPKFLSVITKAKSTEAKLMLKQVYQLQQTYYMENDIYAADLVSLGFEHEKLKTEGGTARYLVRLNQPTPTGFTALAISVVDFDKDGTFNTWQIDQDGIIKETVPD